MNINIPFAIALVLFSGSFVLATDALALSCYVEDGETSDMDVVDGLFSGEQETRLVLFRGDGGCRIRHESDSGTFSIADSFGFDGADFMGVCRDSSSGRDYALVYGGVGASVVYFQVLGVDEKMNPITVYSAIVHDDDDGTDLVDNDGVCLWQYAKKSRDDYAAALRELNGRIPSETVRKWLMRLKDHVILERAAYADSVGQESWLIIQMYTDWLYTLGIVLLLDQNTGEWRSIYDIPEGGSKVSIFRLHSMILRGDKLFAKKCDDCSGWGSYQSVVADLQTHPVEFIMTEDGFPEILESEAVLWNARLDVHPLEGDGENIPIHDIEKEIFAD